MGPEPTQKMALLEHYKICTLVDISNHPLVIISRLQVQAWNQEIFDLGLEAFVIAGSPTYSKILEGGQVEDFNNFGVVDRN